MLKVDEFIQVDIFTSINTHRGSRGFFYKDAATEPICNSVIRIFETKYEFQLRTQSLKLLCNNHQPMTDFLNVLSRYLFALGLFFHRHFFLQFLDKSVLLFHSEATLLSGCTY